MTEVVFSGDGLPTIILRHGRFEDTLDDIESGSVDMVFTSPPFNLGRVGGRKLTPRRKSGGGYDGKSYGAANWYDDDMPESEYEAWQREALRRMCDLIRPIGNVLYHHMDRYENGGTKSPLRIIQPLVDDGVLKVKQEIILAFDSTHRHGPDRFFLQHQQLYNLTRPELGPTKIYLDRQPIPWCDGDNRSTVWLSVPRQAGGRIGHCAPFHIDFARYVVRCFSPPAGLVCDPFSGSGTVALACLLEGRNFIGSEKDENYHQRAVERIAELSGMSLC